jgi:hypothetical protein
MLRQLIISIAAVGVLATATPANAGRCDDAWGCGSNGKSLNGVLKEAHAASGLQVHDNSASSEAEAPAVRAVVLPSGEIINLPPLP